MSNVVLVVSDLLFQSRIEAAVRAQGHTAIVTDARGAMGTPSSDLWIVDLHEKDLDIEALIASARRGGGSVMAFGRHTDVDVLRRARHAGADKVVARSQLAEELPQLIDELLNTASAKEAPL